VLGHSWFVRMTLPDVLVVLLDPALIRLPTLFSIDLTTFAEDAVDTTCFQVKVIIHRLKETGDFHGWEAYDFDIMSSYHPAYVVEDRTNKG